MSANTTSSGATEERPEPEARIFSTIFMIIRCLAQRLKSFQNSKKERTDDESMQLTVLPLLAERKNAEFDLFEALVQTLRGNGDVKFEHGDVLVVSTKYVSNSQGRVIDLTR